jgi:hypothetical protein
MMSEHVVSSAVAQHVKFILIENVKPAEILMKLRAQFGDEMLSRTQMYDWSRLFRKVQTKTKTTPSARKIMASVFLGLLRCLH